MKIAVITLVGSADDYEPLREAGHELIFGPARSQAVTRLTQDELVEAAGDADCLIYNVITPTILAALPKLKLAITPYVGYDKIDVSAATTAGVLVCNTQTEASTAGVAEGTLALMLASAKRLQLRSGRLRNGDWRDDGTERATLIHGSTIGIVGFGAIGQSVARHISGWGARILAYTRTPNPTVASQLGVEMVDLPTLLQQSDIVTLHVPLTPETRGLIGEAELRAMKPNALLINTARGAVVDDQALIRAINEDWIAGAALDVFHEEPLPADDPLRGLDADRVLMTPHAVSNTDAARRGTQRAVVDSILTVVGGGIPGNALNPGVGAPKLG
ncbi:MAG: NAD(P)-dependent oxidoreductase [Chloroflexi bacterium]|nr:NAD(P)-dependent oxidoreductase [Chloroflexota bacterium]MDA1173014.1 NAD(P)-dependent oxidoreductase [Chloroflexota bacterium]